ncbi:MAG: tRNA (adenosine(37)-N6)-threonylcarbamoyltransferase complex ATPase subunit type 1 TsaE [Leptolyngbya sp. SIO1E4]|nr:tRNA (adenosine(37)-N6)-threonylcarbamoyltransferase complex ATPase subunit type 1 TsaE [Leptolyngbya sp. SIO1E4]
MATTLVLPNEHMTQALGMWLGQHLEAGAVLLLQGDLGSGKTTLVKGVGQGLNITESIDSPTFALINEYPQGRIPLYHVDLYRLDPAEAGRLFLEIYWEGVEYPPGIVAIEWSERLQYLPPDPLKVAIAHQKSTGRRVTLTPSTPAHKKLLETLNLDAILADEV